MNRKFLILVFMFSVCLIVGGIGAEEQPQRVMNFLAVMDLDCGKAIDKENCVALTNVVIDELVKIRKYTVIDRANRDKILGEAKFQMTGCVEDRCTIEAGRILGVGKMVVGSISKLGQTYLINLQLLNVETAAVETSGAEECKCELDGLIGAVRNAARKIMGEAPAASSTPQQSAQPPAKLKTNGKCPEDMVYIPEGNFCVDVYEYPNIKGQLPLWNVDYQHAVSLCQSIGKRLPTETEWTTACMGPGKLIYSYGDQYNKASCNTEGRRAASWNERKPSGSYPMCKGWFGTYDMIGNMFEWTSTPFSDTNHMTLKGHSWWGSDKATCLIRLKSSGGFSYDIGFRCAKDAE